MSAAIYNKVEVFFLTFFRWVILLILLTTFIITGYFALNGINEYPLLRSNDVPEKKLAPKQVISKEDFLKEIQSQKEDLNAKSNQPVVEVKKIDEAEFNFLEQANALWTYVDKYQVDCQLQDTLDKEQFIESMRSSGLKDVLLSQKADFAANQREFVKEILGTKVIVDLCKSGKKGIFISLLDYHLHNWNLQATQIQEFEDKETERISQLVKNEQLRIARQHEEAQHSFIIAGIAFLIFMGIAIILIFARIEYNLRGAQLRKID